MWYGLFIYIVYVIRNGWMVVFIFIIVEIFVLVVVMLNVNYWWNDSFVGEI